jgi:hypothetical protein
MPKILIPGPFKFYFYSQDCSEPIHIHVQLENRICKIWIDGFRVATSGGFKEHQLNKIIGILKKNEETIRRKWNEHCCKEK